MKRILLPLLLLIALSGCATQDYKAYADAQANMATARSNADTARYNALSKIAETGTDASKIAAVMALALGNQGASQAQQIAAPPQNEALQWAQVLVPGLTNIAGMALNAKVAITNAESSARVAESTNSAFVGIASKIQAPAAATVITPVTVTPVAFAPVVPQANINTTTTTTSNTSTDNHAVSTTSSTANPTSTTTTSIGGAGVIGNGTFSNQANPVSTTTANPVTTTTTANPVTTTTTTANPVTTTTTTNPPGKTCATSAAGVVNCI